MTGSIGKDPRIDATSPSAPPPVQAAALPLSQPPSMAVTKDNLRTQAHVDWERVGLRALNFMSGFAIGFLVGAKILLAAGLVSSAALLLLSNPIGIGIAAGILLIGLAVVAWKYGGDELLANLAMATGGLFSGFLTGGMGISGGLGLALAAPLVTAIMGITATVGSLSLRYESLSNVFIQFQQNPEDSELRKEVLRGIKHLFPVDIGYQQKNKPTLLELALQTKDLEIISSLIKRCDLSTNGEEWWLGNNTDEPIKVSEKTVKAFNQYVRETYGEDALKHLGRREFR
jgi:hypothetical protein